MLKIAVTGLRGIPDVQGGVETHCAELFPRLSREGVEITVYGRRPYSPGRPLSEWKNVKIKWLPTIPSQKLEAFIHTFLSVIAAKRNGADIIHIHACGPGLFVPFAKMLGLKVVFTHHGEDYKREKWSKPARKILKFGEKLAVKNADAIVCVSPHITDLLKKEYGIEAVTILNGVSSVVDKGDAELLERLGISDSKYIVSVGRLVPEKGFDRLVKAFANSGVGNEYKLVIAGGAQHPSPYIHELNRLAQENGVIMTGSIGRSEVTSLLMGASLFVLASSHEGLPISLLEAMACGKDVLVSDIPSCRLPQLDKADFFDPTDEYALEKTLKTKLQACRTRFYDLSDYNWDKAADKLLSIYRKL